MLNVIKFQNSKEGFEAPLWVKESLENLGRFIPILSEVRNLVQRLNRSGMCEARLAELLKHHADDFYGAWMASSTEVTRAIGTQSTLELLRLFRTFHFITWPTEGLTILEDLPEKLKIFRGESPSLVASGVEGLSWTLNEGTAEFYKNRHHDGILLEGVVDVKDVLVIFMEEAEVVVTRGAVRVERAAT
ncbi:MAG: hypothetical protein D9V46_00565 [Deltaproteobacteria bacterium]|jgi:hypothetical protein|uniref:hypothetical protein n=1 Tax=Hydrosulfovibrio ferrireducens TaxID=2934181 RepID=UPI001223A962|nr:MAG: hypothetical protein D9V46_00565 [Deltaproteobacteria bacterium]